MLRCVETLEAGGDSGLPHWAEEEQQEAERQHGAGRGGGGGVGEVGGRRGQLPAYHKPQKCQEAIFSCWTGIAMLLLIRMSKISM